MCLQGFRRPFQLPRNLVNTQRAQEIPDGRDFPSDPELMDIRNSLRPDFNGFDEWPEADRSK